MSLYGKNDSDFKIEKSLKSVAFLKNGIRISRIVAIPLFIIAGYNLLLILLNFKILFILINDPGFVVSFLWNVISVFLLIYFCFAKTYLSIIPLIIVCILQFLGWATANVEMTQYYYSENKMVFKRNEYLTFLDSIKIIPYFFLNDLFNDATLNSIKIFYMAEEFVKTLLLGFVLQLKIKFNR